jgi:hypothetical protein
MRANPSRGRVIFVSALVRFVRARVRRNNFGQRERAWPVHVPRAVQQLSCFENHFDAVLVAVSDSCFESVGVEQKEIHCLFVHCSKLKNNNHFQFLKKNTFINYTYIAVSLYMHDLLQYWLGHVDSSVYEHPGHFRMNTFSRLLGFSV